MTTCHVPLSIPFGLSWNFKTIYGAGTEQDCRTGPPQATLAGEIDSLESIAGLLKVSRIFDSFLVHCEGPTGGTISRTPTFSSMSSTLLTPRDLRRLAKSFRYGFLVKTLIWKNLNFEKIYKYFSYVWELFIWPTATARGLLKNSLTEKSVIFLQIANFWINHTMLLKTHFYLFNWPWNSFKSTFGVYILWFCLSGIC